MPDIASFNSAMSESPRNLLPPAAADATGGSVDRNGNRRAEHELRNMVALGGIFMVYFGFRSGSLIVMPLCSKELLSEYTGASSFSWLYNLPLGMWFFTDVVLATPNAYFMRKYGRRSGFLLGGVAAFIGSLMAFASLRFLEDGLTAFIGLNVSTVVMAQVGMAEFVRFAAGEACVDPARKGKVVSRVIGLGACFSMIGPGCASLAQEFARNGDGNVVHGYSYFFLCTAALSLFLIASALALRLPDPSVEGEVPAAPLCTVLRRTPVWTSIVAQVTVQFAMVAPMSGVPLVMQHAIPELHPADVRISGCVVLHVLSMFIPGFFTGSIISRIGEFRVMWAGLFVQALSLGVCLTGQNYEQFYSGLCLLGIGWNFAFVASTLMLVSTHTVAERAKVTSANESLRFLANGIAVILASALQWDVLCIVCLVMLLPAVGVLALRSCKQG